MQPVDERTNEPGNGRRDAAEKYAAEEQVDEQRGWRSRGINWKERGDEKVGTKEFENRVTVN